MNKQGATIDNLADMVKQGFDHVSSEITGLTTGFNRIEKRLTVLEQGQEDIKLKLDNVAYRFELVELQRRVELLERKVGVK
jgi:hypothetical protein